MTVDSGAGHLNPSDTSSDFGVISAIARALIAEMSIMKLVQVKAVHGGGLAGPGTVDVLPLVNQIDGNGYGFVHGIVPGIPWGRMQGGTDAVIIDPKVGDFGYVVAADRDSSKVVATKKQANPGSRRQNDICDGIYVGGCLCVAPDQYLIFTETGFRIVGKNGSIESSNAGITVQDGQSNSIATDSTGMTLTDKNANQIQMRAGFVNVVTTSFRVNGVPVTVP